MSLTILPTPADEAARYLGTGAPENLQYQVYPDGIVLAADYPYDERALFAALADLGVELALPPQFSPCG
jgi:hypothetical protein